jgi:hypothetical protein
VKKRLFLKGVLVIVLFVFSASAFASEDGIIQIQGTIMHVDLKKNTVIVNERVFVLDRDSILQDEKGRSMQNDKLRSGNRVSLEGVEDKTGKRNIVRKICLLPK